MKLYAVIAVHAGTDPFRLKRCLETAEVFSAGMGFHVEPFLVRFATAASGLTGGQFADVATLFALRDALRDFTDNSYVLFLDPHNLYPDNYAEAHAIALSGQPGVPGSGYTEGLMLTKYGYIPPPADTNTLFHCCLRTADAREYVAGKLAHFLNFGPTVLDAPPQTARVGDHRYPVLHFQDGTDTKDGLMPTHPYWANYRQWIVGDNH